MFFSLLRFIADFTKTETPMRFSYLWLLSPIAEENGMA
jgi:hypothetical protein